MNSRFSLRSMGELWRYYQVGVLNTLFGFGLYALLVRLGLNLYVAQIVSHTSGAAFNYFSYSRHVFRDSQPAKVRFAVSYVVNYFMGLAALATASQFIPSPYVAGIVSIVIVSLVNYFALKHMVFTRRET